MIIVLPITRYHQGLSLGVKETASQVLNSAATVIGATAGSASSVHANKVAQQLQGQADDMRNICSVYQNLAVSCTRSFVTVSVLACVGDDCHEGGTFFDTALLGEV